MSILKEAATEAAVTAAVAAAVMLVVVSIVSPCLNPRIRPILVYVQGIGASARARAFEALKAHNVDLERVVGVRKELPAELPEPGRSTGGARSRPLEPATVDGLAAATLGGAHFGGFGGLFGYYLETSPTFACFGQRLRGKGERASPLLKRAPF